jgi:hypothetical protein
MFIKAQMLKKRLGYNLRDIQVIRKLGGHNIRRRKNAGGIYEGDYIDMDNSSRPSTPDPSQSEETEKETPYRGPSIKLCLMPYIQFTFQYLQMISPQKTDMIYMYTISFMIMHEYAKITG